MHVRILLVGGPMDGQWMTVQAEQSTIRVQEMDSLSVFPRDDEPLIPKRHIYARDSVRMFGRSLQVAVHEESIFEGMDRDTMLMRAILQRDVVQEMGVR